MPLSDAAKRGVTHMLCQNCQKRIANVHYTHIVNNNKVEMYLCEQCANEKGQFGFISQLDISSFFPGLIGFGGFENAVSHAASPKQRTLCEKCGMSYEDFQKTGKFGCENCYKVYGERIKPLIKRLHGSEKHRGKFPGKTAGKRRIPEEIARLKKELAAAVRNEEYERAAEIRDRIRNLEAGL